MTVGIHSILTTQAALHSLHLTSSSVCLWKNVLSGISIGFPHQLQWKVIDCSVICQPLFSSGNSSSALLKARSIVSYLINRGALAITASNALHSTTKDSSCCCFLSYLLLAMLKSNRISSLFICQPLSWASALGAFENIGSHGCSAIRAVTAW